MMKMIYLLYNFCSQHVGINQILMLEAKTNLHSGQARIILCSNCFACLHFLMQGKQKQWLQEGRIPNLEQILSFITTKEFFTLLLL